MLSSQYIPHALSSLLALSLSLNLLSTNKAITSERARTRARLSVLHSLNDHLSKPDSGDPAELERLTRLASKMAGKGTEAQEGEVKVLGGDVTWTDIFTGKVPVKARGEMSKWDEQDLETRA